MILVPVYWQNYGPQNFLWLSDISLFLTLIALWTESSLLMSILILVALPMELIWNIDFFIKIIAGIFITGISGYMFDSQYSLFLKGLSLFHIALPIIWIWYLVKWGYDKGALIYATFLIWITLILTYFFTDPQKNINLIFLPKINAWNYMPELLWLILLLVAFPLLIMLPLHIILKRFF